ncbi:MAG: hypothetical protein D6761_08900 [Candidatus Dadabacteria bacterium]|nr:MAG: hypothetical protein D6761_08900 [Candidatus Dadabacteria bacterium]
MASVELDLIELLRVLYAHDCRFVVVGGVAAVLHGAPVQTFDLDIVYERTEQNIQRLLAALEELEACYAGFEDRGLRPERKALAGMGHHLLTTRAGRLDVLAFVADQQTFDQLAPASIEVEAEGIRFHIADLETLVELKKHMGREKDLLTAAMLEALREETARVS